MYLTSNVYGIDSDSIINNVKYFLERYFDEWDIHFIDSGVWTKKYLIEVDIGSYSSKVAMQLYFESGDDKILFSADDFAYKLVEFLNYVYKYEFAEDNSYLFIKKLSAIVKFDLIEDV